MQRASGQRAFSGPRARGAVVVELLGGLGNQMFQYATALAVGRRAGLPVRVDTRRLAADPKRELEIDAFPGCRLREAGWWQRLPAEPRVQAVAQRVGAPGVAAFVAERSSRFDPRIPALRAPVYLRGYWQCERYFADAEDRVREAFATEALPSVRLRELAPRLRRPGSVAVHVRRGDYASDAATRRYHGLLSREYYERAVAHVRARVSQPSFHLFSDDPTWVREAFSWLDGAELASQPGAGGRAVEDLALMAACRHHVVANSSYSWWAAWLGTGPGQVVVAPQRWFTAEETDVVPARWHRT